MRWSFFHCCSRDGDMTQSQRTKNEQKGRVVILGLGDLGTRLAQTLAERGLATELKLMIRSGSKLASTLAMLAKSQTIRSLAGNPAVRAQP